MNYQTFCTTFMQQAAEVFPDCQISLEQITKNNGRRLDYLCIRRESEPISPAICLNTSYLLHQDGKPITEFLQEILRDGDHSLPADFTPELLLDFSYVSSRIAFRLVHFASNAESLQTLPHIHFLDLAKVFYLCIKQEKHGQMTLQISDFYLEQWGISLEQLEQLADQNTPVLFPPVMASITEVLTGTIVPSLYQTVSDDADSLKHFSPEDPDPFYVLTNPTGINGASCMAYPGIIKNFADHMERDLYVLPSSIHEVLLAPAENDEDCRELCRTVFEINQAQVAGEERLSNQVYYYSREQNQLSVRSFSPESVC